MRLVALAALPLLLSACGAPSGLLVATYAIDGASYVGTGKTVSDHALSAATKKDCSVLYGVTRGQLCEEAPTGLAEVPSDTRVPDHIPGRDPAPSMIPEPAAEPVMLGDASNIEIDDDFAYLQTTKTSADLESEKPAGEVAVAVNSQTLEAPQKPKTSSTPLWTLVVGIVDTEAAARNLVKRMKPEKALITIKVVDGAVAYRVSTEPFKISEAEARKQRVAHLELTDVHVSRVCPPWMQDDRCVMLDRALSD